MKLETKLKKLKNNEGLTLKAYKPIQYKSGWQVATEGKQTRDLAQALEYIQAYKGNCGVWFSDGIYYIDLSKRVNTKREALAIGRACFQQSVLKWKTMTLAWCWKYLAKAQAFFFYALARHFFGATLRGPTSRFLRRVSLC